MYEIILTTHIATAIGLIATVAYADHLGWQWLRGKHEVLSAQPLHRVHTIIYVGLVVMIATGAYMFWPLREYLLTTPAFLVKMGLVMTLIINSVFIGRFMHMATKKSYALLERRERVPLFISGAVSVVAWIGTIVAATQLGL